MSKKFELGFSPVTELAFIPLTIQQISMMHIRLYGWIYENVVKEKCVL